jgi:hypothetical protein
MIRKRLAGPVLAVITILAAGCGGSGTKSSTTTTEGAASTAQHPVSTSPTGTTPASASATSQFIAAADVICLRLNTQFAASTYKTLKDLARSAPLLAGHEATALSEMRKLTPPQDIADDWKTMLADLQKVVTGTKAMGRYAGHNDPASVQRLNLYLIKVEKHSTALAARHRIVDCSVI